MFAPGQGVGHWLTDRDARQRLVHDWVIYAFGAAHAHAAERALRVVEEVVELAQAEGISRDRVHALVDHVYGKPPGDIFSEAGAVGLTLLAYCQSREISASVAEVAEMLREPFPNEEYRTSFRFMREMAIRAHAFSLAEHDEAVRHLDSRIAEMKQKLDDRTAATATPVDPPR